MINYESYIGVKFNMLTMTKVIGRENYKMICEFKCECGCTMTTCFSNVYYNNNKSCGCLKRKMCVDKNTTHGLSKSPIYKIWKQIKQRCYNKNNKDYKHYGGRGIQMCDRWFDFSNFHKDMYNDYLIHVTECGKAGTTIDRIDVNLGYSPENCKWSTWSEQQLNKRIHLK